MNAHCSIENDWPRPSLRPIGTILAKYGKNVPRYTSYPTAPHFDGAADADVYRSWLMKLDLTKPISLYLHIPFCEKLCFYCGCHTSVVHSRSPIQSYVDCLRREIALTAEAIGAQARVAAIHFGGGTPNSVAPGDLDLVFAALRERFGLDREADIAAELDPRVLTREWIEAARRNGLNRASLGVQDVNPIVQKAINRHQPWRMTICAIDMLRNAGVTSINLDLMYGLPHQTVASLRESVKCAVGAAPERIALFGYAHVPWMKAHQKLIDEAALPGEVERYYQQAAAAETLVQAGYIRIGLDHFAHPSDPLARALASGSVRRNFQGYTTDGAETLLGFGASAIGRLPSGYVQNSARTPEWRAAVAAGRLATARGVELSRDDRLRGEIIERLMCDLKADLSEIATRHGAKVDVLSEALAGLDALAEDGLVSVDGSRVTIPDAGRPFVRAVCAAFDRYFERSGVRHSAGV